MGPFTTSEGRQQLLDSFATAIDELARALSALGAAYEQLDEQQADALEERLFGPVQRAFGRAQRTHAAFADRSGLSRRGFAPPPPGLPSTGVVGFVTEALDSVASAESELVELQDSLLPVEVGDQELREGLASVRVALDPVARAGPEFLRTFGR